MKYPEVFEELENDTLVSKFASAYDVVHLRVVCVCMWCQVKTFIQTSCEVRLGETILILQDDSAFGALSKWVL